MPTPGTVNSELEGQMRQLSMFNHIGFPNSIVVQMTEEMKQCLNNGRKGSGTRGTSEGGLDAPMIERLLSLHFRASCSYESKAETSPLLCSWHPKQLGSEWEDPLYTDILGHIDTILPPSRNVSEEYLKELCKLHPPLFYPNNSLSVVL